MLLIKCYGSVVIAENTKFDVPTPGFPSSGFERLHQRVGQPGSARCGADVKPVDRARLAKHAQKSNRLVVSGDKDLRTRSNGVGIGRKRDGALIIERGHKRFRMARDGLERELAPEGGVCGREASDARHGLKLLAHLGEKGTQRCRLDGLVEHRGAARFGKLANGRRLVGGDENGRQMAANNLLEPFDGV